MTQALQAAEFHHDPWNTLQKHVAMINGGAASQVDCHGLHDAVQAKTDSPIEADKNPADNIVI